MQPLALCTHSPKGCIYLGHGVMQCRGPALGACHATAITLSNIITILLYANLSSATSSCKIHIRLCLLSLGWNIVLGTKYLLNICCINESKKEGRREGMRIGRDIYLGH